MSTARVLVTVATGPPCSAARSAHAAGRAHTRADTSWLARWTRRLAPEVVFDTSLALLILGEADGEARVEVAAGRGGPGEGPPAAQGDADRMAAPRRLAQSAARPDDSAGAGRLERPLFVAQFDGEDACKT